MCLCDGVINVAISLTITSCLAVIIADTLVLIYSYRLICCNIMLFTVSEISFLCDLESYEPMQTSQGDPVCCFGLLYLDSCILSCMSKSCLWRLIFIDFFFYHQCQNKFGFQINNDREWVAI